MPNLINTNQELYVKAKINVDNEGQTSLVELLSDNCSGSADPDCYSYFEGEIEIIKDIFSELDSPPTGDYIIEYSIVCGKTITDFGYQYFTDYELKSISNF